MSELLLAIRDLHVQFSRGQDTVRAVNGISLSVHAGEWLGVLGESGSGKSVTFLSILGLLGANGQVTRGEALLAGHDLLQMKRREQQRVRGRHIGYVFQNVASGLNPFIRVGHQIMEPLLQHKLCGKVEARERAMSLMEEVGIQDPKARFLSYPFELSGGMRQRVMIASALACDPGLLIADEPSTALDATVQIQVMGVLKRASTRRRMSTVLVTHDMSLAANVCDRIVILYGGQVMEVADVLTFIQKPAHPYTIGLRDSSLEVGRREELKPIPGSPITLIEEPVGCPFAARCTQADIRCHREIPVLHSMTDTHAVACHRVEEALAIVH